MSGLYVFALAGERMPPFETAGYRVECIRVAGVDAVIARLDQPPPVTEGLLRRQHEVVVAAASRVDALLPVRFGAFLDRAELAAVLTRRSGTIAEALALVRGRQQMTLRLLEPPTAASPRDAVVPPAMTGAEYLEARRTAAALPIALRAVGDALGTLVRAERAQAGTGKIAPTLYHLIDRGDVASYNRKVADSRSRQPQAAVVVSGPWPPFAFVPDLWP